MGSSYGPIPVRIVRHSYIPERFTHFVPQADARARGWLVFGNIQLGTRRSRRAAWATVARRLERQGIVVIVGRTA